MNRQQLATKAYGSIAHFGLMHLPRLMGVKIASDIPHVSGRVVEWPFVLSNIDLTSPGRVLDVGCSDPYNPIPAALAARGHEVHGLDGRPFRLKYPGFTFHLGDIRRTDFPDSYFDRVLFVSVLEHIGIGGAYGSNDDVNGDSKAIREAIRILRPDGKLIITCPYGKPAVTAARERIYDRDALRAVLADLRLEKEEYWAYDSEWEFEQVSELRARSFDLKDDIFRTPVGCFRLAKHRVNGPN